MVMPRSRSCAENGEQPLGLALVQRRVRLVEDEQPRLLEKHAGELDELALADGEAADRRVDVDVQAEPVEQGAAAAAPSRGSRRSRAGSARG